jgi:hypothetical protein
MGNTPADDSAVPTLGSVACTADEDLLELTITVD